MLFFFFFLHFVFLNNCFKNTLGEGARGMRKKPNIYKKCLLKNIELSLLNRHLKVQVQCVLELPTLRALSTRERL